MTRRLLRSGSLFQLWTKAVPALRHLEDVTMMRRSLSLQPLSALSFPQQWCIDERWMQADRGRHSFTVCYLEPKHCTANTSGFYYISVWALLLSRCMHCNGWVISASNFWSQSLFTADSWVNHLRQCRLFHNNRRANGSCHFISLFLISDWTYRVPLVWNTLKVKTFTKIHVELHYKNYESTDYYYYWPMRKLSLTLQLTSAVF